MPRTRTDLEIVAPNLAPGDRSIADVVAGPTSMGGMPLPALPPLLPTGDDTTGDDDTNPGDDDPTWPPPPPRRLYRRANLSEKRRF